MNSQEFYSEISQKIVDERDFMNDYLILHEKLDRDKEEILFKYKRLLESASILACSEYDTHKSLALNIVTRFIELEIGNENIQAAIEIILARLGVFPGLLLSIERCGFRDFLNLWNGGEVGNLPPALASEIFGKELQNKVTIGRETLYLTDFQAKVLNALRDKKNLSISAPTSAGKSFILIRYIIECVMSEQEFTVVYIVPTRALISQVRDEFSKTLKYFNIDVEVFTSSYEVVGEGRKPYKKAIMILTQERLQTIEGKTEKLRVDLLIVDEAHKIEIGSRGITLEESVQRIVEWNPDSQYVFISPYAENPGKIGNVFNFEKIKVLESDFSPVNQNLFLINEEGSRLEITLYDPGIKKSLFKQEIPLKDKLPSESYLRKAYVTNYLVKDGPTMVYCNKPDLCRKTASALTESKGAISTNEDVKGVINFLEKHVHKDYYLIDYLKRGVAYHYGSVPPSVRKAIESLFSNMSIDVVCCTSTLIEGVNFPAKNIVLHNPRMNNKPMDSLSYFNIAGRAGRLMKDFSGNIYAIDVEEWPGHKPDDRTKHKIKSSMEEVISQKKDIIIKHLRNYIKEKGNEDVQAAQAAVTRFIINEVRRGNKEFVGQLLERNTEIKEEDLEKIVNSVKEIVEQLEIPASIILSNLSLDPRIQDSLYKELSKREKPPIPLHPSRNQFFNNFYNILKFTNYYFHRGWTKRQIRYFTLLSSSWANEKTLGEIILERLDFVSENNQSSLTKKEINKEIEDIIDLINNTIHYEIRRDIGAYINILGYIEEEKSEDYKMDDKLGYYLEIGACRRTTLTLINNGVPRTAAILISRMLPENLNDISEIRKIITKNQEKFKTELPIFMLENIFY